jgi:RNA polymerase sigma factor (sigma-70 family)
MPTDQSHDVLHQVRRAALFPDGGASTDAHLLECFVRRRDEAAFEALVRRHGPMVLGVCRRLLRHPQDAEDAFQATFLVLVRKAAVLGHRELLGNWLYGVAYRTALDARAAAARRRARERQVSPMPEAEVNAGAGVGRDLRGLLDRELNRLPDKYRVPVVLCDLQGKTRRDVAAQLGVPVGTLSGRLTTAHRLLARRLGRHGLSLAGGALAAVLSEGAAPACVPAPLVAATVEAAAGAVSAPAAALAEGVVKALLLRKLQIATAMILAAATVVGAARLAHQPMAARAPAEVIEDNPQPPQADKSAGPPRVLQLGWRGRRVVWSPDGKTLAVVTKNESLLFGRSGSAIKLWDVDRGAVRATLAESGDKGLAFQHVVFSADSKGIAATVNEAIARDVVKVWDAKTLALKQTLGGESQLVCVALSPDGKYVAAGDPSKRTVPLWNAATGVLERTLGTGVAQPWCLAFSPDRKTLVVGGQKSDHSGEVQLWDARKWTLKHTLKQDRYVNTVAFAPDGKAIAVSTGGAVIQLWDVEKGKEIASLQGNRHGQRSVAYSPDGKLVAAGGPDGKIRLWDARTGELRQTLEDHDAEVYSVAFAPDGKTLASVSQDATLRLWPLRKRGAGTK